MEIESEICVDAYRMVGMNCYMYVGGPVAFCEFADSQTEFRDLTQELESTWSRLEELRKCWRLDTGFWMLRD